MAILATDIKLRLSTTAGSAGDSTAAGAVGNSLGKYMSTTDITTSNVFPDITGAQNAQGSAYKDYQCVFVYNSAAQDALNVVVWNSSDVAGGASADMALDSTAASAHNNASAQALTIANATTAPAGPLTFSASQSAATGLNIGTLAAGQVKAVWLRRTAANSGPLNNDGLQLEVDFDTGA